MIVKKFFSSETTTTTTPSASSHFHETPFLLGEHETKGERSTMEDTHLVSRLEDHEIFFIAVFDGHNGNRCSKYLKDRIMDEFQKQLTTGDLEDAIKKTYYSLDRNWIHYAQSEEPPCDDGSTGLCVIMQNQKIFVANTGDCRALMKCAGKCVEMSRDHRPIDPEEMKRIKECGGEVIGGRLQGELAVSRAFGDYRFKNSNQSLLICEPEIRQFNLRADIEFIVVACDGLYETFTNDEVIEYISRLLSDSVDINEIAKTLAEEAIDRGSGDNITIIIIKFEKKLRKILNTAAIRASKKKPSYEDLINVKRKSLDTCKSLTSDPSKKRPFQRPEGNYDELESESLDELDSPDGPAVTFLDGYPYVHEPDIKLRIKKKDQGTKSKSNKKSKSSKEKLNNIMVKKCKSKEDLPKGDTKKGKVVRRRSKSNDTGRIPKEGDKRSKKKADSSSDEFEKELLKSLKKKKRNSMNIKCPNEPIPPTLRSTMNESLLTKNSKTKKTKSEASQKTLKTEICLGSPNTNTLDSQNNTINKTGKPLPTDTQPPANSSSVKSFQRSSMFIQDGNAKSRSASETTGIKSPKLLSSDCSPKVDQLQSHKTTQYVCKKH